MERSLSEGQRRMAAILRVAVGFIFLTAGLEKAFLGAEPFDAAAFLAFGTNGTPVLAAPAEGIVYNPTHAFWAALAANGALMPLVNGLVVVGQLAIGLALVVGLATRFAAAMGTLMMALFLVAAWELEHGVVNQHVLYALVTAFVGCIGAGRWYGLDGIVERLAIVRQAPRWRNVLG